MGLKSKIWTGSLILVTVFTGCFLSFFQAKAMGISPPWIINHDLLRGSHFEKTVNINQGDPKEPLHAKVDLENIPVRFRDWITVEPGMEFTIPMVNLFPVTVIVDVPLNADFSRYEGSINITTLPETEGEAPLTVGIGIGIVLDLEVVEKEIFKFTIPTWRIKPMEEGWPVTVIFELKNEGNIKARPIKVQLDVFDGYTKKRVSSAEDTDLAYVAPFTSSEIVAEFPVDLEIGYYWAEIKVYKTEDEFLEFENNFEVVEKGALPQEMERWVLWLLIIVGACALVGVIFWIRPKGGKKITTQFSVKKKSKRVRPSTTIKKKSKKTLKVPKEI